MNIIKELDSILSAVEFKDALKYSRFRRDLLEQIDDYLTNMFGVKQGTKNPDKSYKVQRIFFPVNIELKKEDIKPAKIRDEKTHLSEYDMYTIIKIMIDEYNYSISSENSGKKLKEFTEEDYFDGYVYTQDGKRKQKLVKFINSLEKNIRVNDTLSEVAKPRDMNVKELKELIINTFNTRMVYNPEQKFMMCISRHPVDVAGMSTNQRWKSCMTLPSKNKPEGGIYYDKLEKDIKLGTIVAYLIDENGKDLKKPKPFARIVAKLFLNHEEKNFEFIFESEPSIYHDGVFHQKIYKQFSEEFDKWLEEKQQKIIPGLYIKHSELYNDGKKTIQKYPTFSEDQAILFNKLCGFINRESSIDQINETKDKLKDVIFRDDNIIRFLINNENYINGGILIEDISELKIRNYLIINKWSEGCLDYYNKNFFIIINDFSDGIVDIPEDGYFIKNWHNGEWIKGNWYSECNWDVSSWHNGIWRNGFWQGGNWYKGTWHNGTWSSGYWYNGTWENGTWYNGKWSKGIWKTGKWYDGFWGGGTWIDGIWKQGIITSYKFINREIFSKVNPNEFHEIEKNCETVEELKEKVG